ncbi:hypothetical protein HMPREF1321_1177 [Capnocytophaga sp. oral taxon 412 str. F0487]|nr:hypothetical protein HMPREF1321_1177 [Capnocytophaga sp. oral taxon 412 str. F0487]
MKAIHNQAHLHLSPPRVVINRKTTKFESNSQHVKALPYIPFGCYQSQNYKI